MYRHEKLSLYFNVVIDTSLFYQQVFGMFFPHIVRNYSLF